ncbi:VCBS repeat-containing protein [Maribacter aurantiacus]|uniref:VCBS repeat-containing protein n=1 Tax=Maribacter aurantiacus TaxID=1882343 RepID=A0A5R8MDP1_9FLAO|nr:VCBS repeat-containing protein [Maribacter aurantiacus]TLF46869.1 VCBS repeat-containing protein [Maribacter aurantiacus]
MKAIRSLFFWNFIFAFLTLSLFSCKKEEANPFIPLFNLRDSNTGIHFENNLVYDEQFNPYLYRNFYNGGGVALGDVNNDGLIDIYFTGNMVDNKLFLNKGNWQFEDITINAGVACPNVWSTGATFADINKDGLLDLYVCKAGKPEGSNRHNELFINNGDLTFTESSKEYGLDIEGLSVHSAFFDYDKDGDLDVYILNNSLRSIGGFDLKKDLRMIPDKNGNKFLRNDDGKFIDITHEVGIYSSKIGFGLGITLGDFNNDNWTDIFISNDFFERDYLYINDTKGGFTENLEEYFESISMGSMGADLADLDNDMLTDLIVTEMLPATEERKKTKTLFESWDKQQLAEKQGYFNQFARNALQKNLGNGSFLEVSRQANVSGTEWSWGALIFDMDNDGFKDIFVSNGIYKDLLDRDYLAFDANEEKIRNRIAQKEKNVITTLIDAMPSQAVANSVFRNKGNFNFENTAETWGLDTPSFSNGSAYGDLDNDGDLDLVVNNVNMPSFLYENTTDTLNQRSIQLEFFDKELRAIGAKAMIKSNGKVIGYGENFVSRGFQSSVPYGLHFGVGNRTKIDSLIITWPNGTVSTQTDLRTNQKYRIDQPIKETSRLESLPSMEKYSSPLGRINPLFHFMHTENRYIDFDNERLLPHMSSNEGPALTTADINADGKPDFFVGGAKNQAGKLFVSNDNGYTEHATPFLKDAGSEDTDAVFFDGDGDGDLDLYVCHGGKAFSPYSIELNDAYYINDGTSFIKSQSSPNFSSTFSSSVVTASDFDKDGDIDLFVGERYKTNLYGLPVSGYILENDGKGNFTTKEKPHFKNLGMITDAQWGDVNGDGWDDLLVVGEWMPIKVFINKGGIFEDQSTAFGFSGSSGLWKAIELKDIDEDGDLDLIIGNIGRNAFYEKNMKIFIADFDGNGFQEQLICKERNGKYYPIADKDELVSQIPSLKKKFLYYKDYAKADMTMIFSKEQLAKCYIAELDIIESTLFINQGGSFKAKVLPDEIQYAPVYAISIKDINNDGYQDLFLGGNQYMVKPQFGRYDASKGWAIFGPIISQNSEANVNPLFIEGQIRALEWVTLKGKKILTIGNNNEEVLFYEFKNNQ